MSLSFTALSNEALKCTQPSTLDFNKSFRVVVSVSLWCIYVLLGNISKSSCHRAGCSAQ